MDGWCVFGDRSKFSFEYKFLDDPDPDGDVSAEMSASWGSFRFFIEGVNVCESVSFVGADVNGHKMVLDGVTWYLLPLFEWLALNWNPLFHESSFPYNINTYDRPNVACNVYDQYETVLCDIETKKGLKDFKKWQKWWGRHALRSASAGGVFPDVFFRRLVNDMEVSWGDARWPGMPDEYSLARPGAAILALSDIAPHMYAALEAGISDLRKKCSSSDGLSVLLHRVEEIMATPVAERLRWFSCAADVVTRVGNYAKTLELFGKNVIDCLFVREPSPILLMFGAVSPSISSQDIDAILRWIEARGINRIADARQGWGEHRPLDFSMKPAEDGYGLAAEFAERIALFDVPVDIQKIYGDLGFGFYPIDLMDPNIRAITIVVEGMQPSVAVNMKCRFNVGEEGFRFTLAHELCHILYDKKYGQSLAIVSGPWAPLELEKRANAFAAMLLMPRNLIAMKIKEMKVSFDSVDDIFSLARELKTSPKATYEHLANLGFIDYIRHELLQDELDSRCR